MLTAVAGRRIQTTAVLGHIIHNTIRQMQTPDKFRDRMTSINQILFIGGPHLGELEADRVSQLLGVPFAVISSGLGYILSCG